MINELQLFAYWVIFNAFVVYYFFFKIFQEQYQSVKRLSLDQDRHSVGPDLGPNCLQPTKVPLERKELTNTF